MTDRRIVRTTLVTVLAALALGACGEKPEALLASARDYLAKRDTKAAIIQIKTALQAEPSLAEARFLLGKALMESGDLAGAEVELRRALEYKYPADQVVPLLAQTLLATGQAKKLLTDLGSPELSTPEAKADWQIALALAHASLGQMDRGRAALQAAVAAKAEHPATLLTQARFALADRDPAAALGFVDKALAKDATQAEAWRFKGDLLAQQGKSEEAVPAYRKAVELRPDSVAAYGPLLMALMRQQQMDEAGAVLAAMKKAAPKHPLTFLAEGQYLYQKKEFPKARDAVQEALKLLPDNPQLLLLAGAVHLQLNSLPQAQDYLSRAVRALPGAVQAKRMLATVHLRMGQPAKALAVIEPLVEEGGQDADLLSLAGTIYMQNGLTRQAEEFFGRAAQLDPADPRKRTSVALSHMAAGKDSAFDELATIATSDTGTTADMALISAALARKEYAKALKAIDALEKKKGAGAMVHGLRGATFAAKGDLTAARTSFEAALAADPAYLPAAGGLARLDLMEKKPEDAKKRFEAVLAADAKNLQAMLALAELKARTGARPEEVEALLTGAVQSHPTEAVARVALINFHLGRKDAKKAMSVGQDALAAIPDRPEILDGLGRAQQAAGDTNQALATFRKLSSLLPTAPRVHLRLAEVQVAAKDRDAAMQSVLKALELSPNYLAAQRALMILHLDAGNLAAAQAVVREIRKQRPKEVVATVLEGDLAAWEKSWGNAANAYRAALKQQESADLAVKLHRVLEAAGKSAEADRFAASWLSGHPADVGMRLYLSEVAMGRKDYPLAIRHYHALLQQQPDNPMVLNNLAWALGAAKDPRALEYAEKANALAPNQPPILDTLGGLYAEKGDTGKALEILQKALELSPSSPSVRLSLARVMMKAGKTADARRHLEELAKWGDKFPGHAEVSRLLKEAGG